MNAIETGKPIKIKYGPMCRWCSRSVSKGTICARCERWADDSQRNERWNQLTYARVEVLTPAAAKIARTFSAKAQREDFDFTPILRDESRQMILLAGYRTDRTYEGYVQTASGRYVSLWEEIEVPVPFTLLPFDPNSYRLRPHPAVGAYGTWWKKAMKIAKGIRA